MFPLDALLNIGNTIINKLFPDPAERDKAQLALLQMQQNGELAAMTAQTDINKVEAGSVNLFVAGWRPAIGWICGCALAYSAILEPFIRMFAALYGYTGAFPNIDTTLTMQVLLGMLGLGAMRSFDKVKGVSTK